MVFIESCLWKGSQAWVEMQNSLMQCVSDYEEIILPAQTKFSLSLHLSLSPLSDPTFHKIKQRLSTVFFILHFLAFIFVLTIWIMSSLVHLIWFILLFFWGLGSVSCWFFFLKPGYQHHVIFLRFDGVNSIKYYAFWNWYWLIKTVISVRNIFVIHTCQLKLFFSMFFF